MNKIVDHQNGNLITREACAWIAQLDGDTPPSPEDLAALREWMGRSSAHRREISRLAELWSQFDVLTELAAAPRPARSVRRWGSAGFMARAAVGVAAILVACVGALFWLAPGQDGIDPVYRTAVGEQRRVVLPDGSALLLNTSSEIAVDYGPQQRHLRLIRGEAHFQVEHDVERPFVVEAGDGLVRAVGTAFSVRRHGAGAEVSVTDGVVSLSVLPAETDSTPAVSATVGLSAGAALLKAGQSAAFDGRIDQIKDVPEDELERKLAWRHGLLVFSGDRLDHVVSEVSRYTQQNIEFDDPALGELRMGGQFRIGETEALFRALEDGFDVRVRRDGQRVILSRAEPSSYQ